MRNTLHIFELLLCMLSALPFCAQESAMEQFMAEHRMGMLTADSIDPNHDDMVITALAMQQLTTTNQLAHEARPEPSSKPTPQPCVLQIDTVSGRAELLAMNGRHLADVHFTLVDSTWYMWLSVDPLADQNIPNSPYMYCNGNPIMMIDPDGNYSVNKISEGERPPGQATHADAQKWLKSHDPTGESATLFVTFHFFPNASVEHIAQKATSFSTEIVDCQLNMIMANYQAPKLG